MSKIGIFGSSFNPIHMGHLIICEQARVRLGLDKIILVPTKNPYHKKTDYVDFEDRLRMAQLSVNMDQNYEVSDIENELIGNSYTYDVIKLLRNNYSNEDFYFIMGSDSLIGFDKWFKSDKLMANLDFVVFKRPEDGDISNLVDIYVNKGMRLHYFDDIQVQISSTYLRKSISEGLSVKYLIPDLIIDYIKEKDLYNEEY